GVSSWQPLPGPTTQLVVTSPVGAGSWMVQLVPPDDLTAPWRLLADGAFRAAPALSPDGRQLATLESTSHPARFRVRVITLDTGAVESAELELPAPPEMSRGGPDPRDQAERY